jgi:hypothetical protein
MTRVATWLPGESSFSSQVMNCRERRAADRATYPAPELCYKLTVGVRGLDG